MGLGPEWQCLAANDFCPKKQRAYLDNAPPGAHFIPGDVAAIEPAQLPGRPDLVWASFPCQDLSLAGNGAGLKGDRSGTFWPFWKLVVRLQEQQRAPDLIVLENVVGALTSHGGKDFRAILAAAVKIGYRVGAFVVDAVEFVPQSRKRLFFAFVRQGVPLPDGITTPGPSPQWHPAALTEALALSPRSTRDAWVWWQLPAPPCRPQTLADLIEDEPDSVAWHSQAQTRKLLGMMSDINREKVRDVQRAGTRMVGTVYRRTRPDGEGGKVQRAEVRFDGISGCLRTPAGGSSRQTILVVEGKRIRSRLLSSREAARLMGVPDSYRLPESYNDAYHLMGDGLVVPVVGFISEHLLRPLAMATMQCQADRAA